MLEIILEKIKGKAINLALPFFIILPYGIFKPPSKSLKFAIYRTLTSFLIKPLRSNQEVIHLEFKPYLDTINIAAEVKTRGKNFIDKKERLGYPGKPH